jgi:hypothetical protein
MTSGLAIQVLSCILLLIQAALVPYLIGMHHYGYAVYMTAPVYILAGMLEPVLQVSLLKNRVNIFEGYARKQLLYSLAFSILVVAGWAWGIGAGARDVLWLMFLTAGYLLTVALTLVCYLLKNNAAIMKSMALGIAGYVLALFVFPRDYTLYVYANLIYFIVVGAYLLAAIVPMIRDFEFAGKRITMIECIDGISSRIIYVFLGSFLLLIAGILHGYETVALSKIYISVVNAARFAFPLPLSLFFRSLSSGGVFKLFNRSHSLRPLHLVELCTAVYAVVLCVLYWFSGPFIMRILKWDGSFVNAKMFFIGGAFALASPYLSLALLHYGGGSIIRKCAVIAIVASLVGMYWDPGVGYLAGSIVYFILLFAFLRGKNTYECDRTL